MKHFLSKVKKSCKRFMTGKSGFSLVELIVVIAIMAVMAAVLAPALLGYVERSRAQKDDSAMSEVVNSMKLSLADQDVYDELLPYAVKGNFSCYADGDTSTNIDANKTITKAPDYWLFTDEARKLDETPYKPAGSMRGATVTFKPNGEAEYILKAGVVNQIGDESTKKGTNGGAVLEDCPELYNRLRSTVGDTIKVSSQTYRNSTYTIFISMGTTGGNQADKQDAIQVYGQYNGTNLPEVMTATGSASQDKGNAGSEQPGDSEGQPDVSANIIPVGATYMQATGTNTNNEFGATAYDYTGATLLTAGQEFPELKDGDKYTYGDYVYVYNGIQGVNSDPSFEVYQVQNINGWYVDCPQDGVLTSLDNSILERINNANVVNMRYTFHRLGSASNDYYNPIEIMITIPKTVMNIEYLFDGPGSPVGTIELPCHLYANYQNIEGFYLDGTITEYHYDGCDHN